MKNVFKIMITALSMVLIIAAMPFAASAEAPQALGEESPFISAQFLNEDGDEVDGNSLAADETYTVNLILSDISNVAVFNLTADITDDIDITNVTSIAEVENSGFEYGGYKIKDNTFVIVISTVSNTSYTALDGDTVMVTLTVDVKTDGDFADFFQISTSRNHTFIIANLEEGNEKAYVYKDLEASSTDFPFLDFDMSPSSSITVTGTVKVATDEFGGAYADDSKVIGATVETADGSVSVTTDENGQFSIVVPDGTTSLVIRGDAVPARTITLSGTEVTGYPVIPVIAVDFDNSGSFNSGDKTFFNDYFADRNQKADLDGSGSSNSGDRGIFSYFFAGKKSVAYSDFTL